MLIPGKYEDVSRTPIVVGAWLLKQLRQNNSLSLAYEAASSGTDGHDFSASEVTAGLCFLFACGLVNMAGDRVRLIDARAEAGDRRFDSLVRNWGVSSPELVRCLHDLLIALRVA